MTDIALAPLEAFTQDDVDEYATWLEKTIEMRALIRAEDERFDRAYDWLSVAAWLEEPPKQHMVRLEECRYVCGFWNDPVDDVTHAYPECTGNATTHSSTSTGWLCERCIEVEPFFAPDKDVAPSLGKAQCLTCKEFQKMSAFPTAIDSGFRIRDTRECRPCRDLRKVTGDPKPKMPARWEGARDTGAYFDASEWLRR